MKHFDPAEIKSFLPQKALLEVLYDIFQLTIPVATADFTEALISVGGYVMT